MINILNLVATKRLLAPFLILFRIAKMLDEMCVK